MFVQTISYKAALEIAFEDLNDWYDSLIQTNSELHVQNPKSTSEFNQLLQDYNNQPVQLQYLKSMYKNQRALSPGSSYDFDAVKL